MSLAKLNIDYFHEYNAHYGLESGDSCLCEVARLLGAEMSQRDQMLARLNGAEFAIILPGVSCENARLLLLRMIKSLADKKIEHAESRINPYLTISVGLSNQMVGDKSSLRKLIADVDEALKSARAKGRNRMEIIDT